MGDRSSTHEVDHKVLSQKISIHLLGLQITEMAAAAAKIASPHPLPYPLSSISLPSKLNTKELTRHHPQLWLGQGRAPTRHNRQVLRVSLQEHVSSSYLFMEQLQLHHHYYQNQDSMFLLAESVGYSLASYYTSLGLFVISVPGLWSLIKRSVKSKVRWLWLSRSSSVLIQEFVDGFVCWR